MQQDLSSNPFAGGAGNSTLGRKRDAEESGMDASSSSIPAAAAGIAHAVMPLPKRRTTDLNVPTISSLNNASAADPQAYHAFDAMPHSPQHSLNLYANNNGQASGSPGIQTDGMTGYGYYSGTIAVGNPENGQVDPNTKHILRHIQMPSYNPSNPSSSLNSPSAHSVFTATTDADAQFYFEHDSPDMMRDEDTSVATAEGSNGIMSAQQQNFASNEEAMMQQHVFMQQQQQQQQQEQLYLQQQQQAMQMQMQQQQPLHPMLDPSSQQQQQANVHPLSNLAGTGLFTTSNPIKAAYDSYNGGFLDEFDDSMAGRYTGQNGDQYAARLEGVMGHA